MILSRVPANQLGWLHHSLDWLHLSDGKHQCSHCPVRHRIFSHPGHHQPSSSTGYTSHMASIDAYTHLPDTEHALIQGTIQPAQLVTPPTRLVTSLTWQVAMSPFSCPTQNMFLSRTPTSRSGWIHVSPSKYYCLHSPAWQVQPVQDTSQPVRLVTSVTSQVILPLPIIWNEYIFIQGTIQPSNHPGWLYYSRGNYQCLHLPVGQGACSHLRRQPTRTAGYYSQLAGYTSHLTSNNASTHLSCTEHNFM